MADRNYHIMNVKEADFPEKFRPIIRRLQLASQEKKVRDIMVVEDDFLNEIQDYEFRIAESEKLRKEERRQKEEALKKQEEERRQKEEALKKQDEERRQKEMAQRKQEEALKKQEEAVNLLLKMGMPKEEIIQSLELPSDYFDIM